MKALKKHILLLVGGPSKENNVSRSSGISVYQSLIRLGYKVTKLEFSNSFFVDLQRIKPDIVFNCLHGTFGEDGIVPAILEYLRIPYTHSGVESSAVAMNKIFTKKLAESIGIKTPSYLVMQTDELFDSLESGIDPFPRPYVIKAVNQGSTIGVYIILDQFSDLPKRQEWEFGSEVLIEDYIHGKEISVAVLDGHALGVLELRPKSKFYDYDAKYIDGATDHIYPAEIPKDVYLKAKENAEKIHKLLGCRTISRSDMRYDDTQNADGLFFLEINTHPGFTNLSIFPEIAAHNGITFDEIVEQLINNAKCETVI